MTLEILIAIILISASLAGITAIVVVNLVIKSEVEPLKRTIRGLESTMELNDKDAQAFENNTLSKLNAYIAYVMGLQETMTHLADESNEFIEKSLPELMVNVQGCLDALVGVVGDLQDELEIVDEKTELIWEYIPNEEPYRLRRAALHRLYNKELNGEVCGIDD